jgi:hypothetical protein
MPPSVGPYIKVIQPRNMEATDGPTKEVQSFEKVGTMTLALCTTPSLTLSGSGKRSTATEVLRQHSAVEWKQDHRGNGIVWWNYTLDDTNHRHGIRNFAPHDLPQAMFISQHCHASEELQRDQIYLEISSFWSLSTAIENDVPSSRPRFPTAGGTFGLGRRAPMLRYRNFYHRLMLCMPANLKEDEQYIAQRYSTFVRGEGAVSTLEDAKHRNSDSASPRAEGSYVPNPECTLSGRC